jgi:hypothetical protein
MEILKLTLKKKWFDMILSGEKKEEYREIKDFFVSRFIKIDKLNNIRYQLNGNGVCSLFNYSIGYKGKRNLAIKHMIKCLDCSFKNYDLIEFSNGYGNKVPKLTIECKGIEISKGNTEWGAESNVEYFVINLGQIVSTSNLL